MIIQFIDDSLEIPDDKKEAIDRDQRSEARSRDKRKRQKGFGRHPRLLGETRPLDKK